MISSAAQQTWFAIDITVDPEAAAAMEFALDSLDALGTEINYLRKNPGEAVTVIGYFNVLPDPERIRDEIHYALRIHDLGEGAVLSLERREIENTDWLSEWKKHWKPTETACFIIAPPWETVADASKIVITIEPNMAFGTGTHETTRLCLRSIAENYIAGESFLDVGTGTGILAIAAAKLDTSAKAKIFACDTDADSIRVARENAVLNGVDERIEFHTAPVSVLTPQFDFVCANLTLDGILANLGLLVEKSRRFIVLSGILREQESATAAGLKTYGVAGTIARAGDWVSFTIEKQHSGG